MPDYASNVAALVALCDPSITWKPVDILNNVVDTAFSPTNFSNGTFEYSNTNYILLGMIAEEEGGEDLNVLLEETFFTPLEIELVLAPREDIPSNIAHPYDETALFGADPSMFYDLSIGIIFVDPSYNYYTGTGRGTWAAGGIIGTAGNLARWGYELYSPNGSAVSTELRTLLKSSAPGDSTYGYGITNIDFTYDDATSGTILGHDGSAPGYKTLLRYEVTEGVTVAIITNANNSVDGTGLLDRESLAKALFNAYHENKDLEPATP